MEKIGNGFFVMHGQKIIYLCIFRVLSLLIANLINHHKHIFVLKH